MASKGGVTIIVAGEDKTGDVFNAVKRHLDETRHHAEETSLSLAKIGEMLKTGLETAGIAMGAEAVVEGFKEMVKSTMEAGVQLSHLHEQTGISIENLSVLKYAAAESGLEFDTLTRGFKKLAVTANEADNGNKAAAKGFNMLGISMADLRAKGDDMYAVLALVADKFHAMPDGMAKSDAAAKIFGARMGSELIPLLNQGSEALEKFKEEAPIFSDADIENMKKMHEATVQLDAAYKRMSMTVVTTLAPSITSYLNNFSAGLDEIIPKLKAVWDLLTGVHAKESHAWGGEADPIWGTPAPKPAPPPPPPPSGKGGGGSGGGVHKTAKEKPEPFTVDTDALDEQGLIGKANMERAVGELDRADAEGAAAWDKMVADAQASQEAAIAALFKSRTNVTLAAQPLFGDPGQIGGEAEKFAHGAFDPLFNISERWDQRWKQIRGNMLRDLGQTAENQIFGALFEDNSGYGGKGRDGSKGRKGLDDAGGLLGNLLGTFHKKSTAVSNGVGAGGAGTVASPAASLMQLGRSAGAGPGGIQVVINNTGAPVEASGTQQSGGGTDGEQQVIQIMLKQLETNGAVAQGIMGLIAMA